MERGGVGWKGRRCSSAVLLFGRAGVVRFEHESLIAGSHPTRPNVQPHLAGGVSATVEGFGARRVRTHRAKGVAWDVPGRKEKHELRLCRWWRRWSRQQ